MEEGGILFDQGILRFSEDSLKILLDKRLQLHTDGKTPLQLWNEIRRLCDMECASCDKENMICFDRTVLCHHSRALDNRQDIALYPLARNIRPRAASTTYRNLINLIQKNDTAVLCGAHCFFSDGIHIDEFVCLLDGKQFACLSNSYFPLTVILRHEFTDH